MVHYFMDEFKSRGIKEAWIQYGIGVSPRFILIHILYHKLEKGWHIYS